MWWIIYTNIKVYSWTQDSFAAAQWPAFIAYKKNDNNKSEAHLKEEKHVSQRW